MQSTLFQNGMRVIQQILNFAQSAWQNTFENRTNDYSQAGVVRGEFGEFTIIAGSNNTPTTPSVSIGAGSAYDPLANRIFISLSDTTTYNAANPSQTTDDGTGNFVPTPQSTGCINVPLTVNTFNYIWIDYLGTIDPTIFTLQDFTLAKQFYSQSDGYAITVTTINTPPDVNSIFLGSVNLTSGGVVSSLTISQLGRTYSANLPYRTLIETPATNLSDRTTTYTLGNTYFLDDHTKAVGTGTVSAINPHGISPADIGLSGSSTIQFHQNFLHSPGLVGAADNLQAQIISVIPGFDRLVVNPIGPNEVLTSNGISLTNNDIPNPTTLQYTNTDPSGVWYIYVDIINKVVSRTQVDLILTPNPNQYLIYTVVYTFPDPDSSNGHLSALTDFRVFGNIGTREIQAHAVTGVKISPTALAATGALSKDSSDNIQVNVDNISIDITGGDALAVKGTGVAGSGLVGSGTTVNVNPDNTSINIISNQVEVANNGITPIKISTSSVGAGLTGGGGAPIAMFDGSASTRLTIPVSFGNMFTNNVWQLIQTSPFTISGTTQVVIVYWDWNIISTNGPAGANRIRLGLSIDNIPLGYIDSVSTIAINASLHTLPNNFVTGSSANPTFTPASAVLTLLTPALALPTGSHSLQLYFYGGTSTTGVISTTGAIYLGFSIR